MELPPIASDIADPHSPLDACTILLYSRFLDTQATVGEFVSKGRFASLTFFLPHLHNYTLLHFASDCFRFRGYISDGVVIFPPPFYFPLLCLHSGVVCMVLAKDTGDADGSKTRKGRNRWNLSFLSRDGEVDVP